MRKSLFWFLREMGRSVLFESIFMNYREQNIFQEYYMLSKINSIWHIFSRNVPIANEFNGQAVEMEKVRGENSSRSEWERAVEQWKIKRLKFNRQGETQTEGEKEEWERGSEKCCRKTPTATTKNTPNKWPNNKKRAKHEQRNNELHLKISRSICKQTIDF